MVARLLRFELFCGTRDNCQAAVRYRPVAATRPCPNLQQQSLEAILTAVHEIRNGNLCLSPRAPIHLPANIGGTMVAYRRDRSRIRARCYVPFQSALFQQFSAPGIGTTITRSLQLFFIVCHDTDRFREFVSAKALPNSTTSPLMRCMMMSSDYR